jgi:hypothetical protein
MDSRDYLMKFVDECGGKPAAAKQLRIPYSTLAAICNGTRGIGKRLAERMAANSAGKLSASRLIWVQADREGAAA